MAAQDEISFAATAEFRDCSADVFSTIFCILSIQKVIFAVYINTQN